MALRRQVEIDESAKFDENVRDWFNLTEQSWNNMSEAGRNSLRIPIQTIREIRFREYLVKYVQQRVAHLGP